MFLKRFKIHRLLYQCTKQNCPSWKIKSFCAFPIRILAKSKWKTLNKIIPDNLMASLCKIHIELPFSPRKKIGPVQMHIIVMFVCICQLEVFRGGYNKILKEKNKPHTVTGAIYFSLQNVSNVKIRIDSFVPIPYSWDRWIYIGSQIM